MYYYYYYYIIIVIIFYVTISYFIYWSVLYLKIEDWNLMFIFKFPQKTFHFNK